jgi:hypothetical protein
LDFEKWHSCVVEVKLLADEMGQAMPQNYFISLIILLWTEENFLPKREQETGHSIVAWPPA